jgi:hypothetical protein
MTEVETRDIPPLKWDVHILAKITNIGIFIAICRMQAH